jgi:hypothetical protein
MSDVRCLIHGSMEEKKETSAFRSQFDKIVGDVENEIYCESLSIWIKSALFKQYYLTRPWFLSAREKCIVFNLSSAIINFINNNQLVVILFISIISLPRYSRAIVGDDVHRCVNFSRCSIEFRGGFIVHMNVFRES